MMAVCTDEGGKPLAMAEIMTDANGPILGQVAGPCNQDVSKEIQEAFVNVVQGLLSR